MTTELEPAEKFQNISKEQFFETKDFNLKMLCIAYILKLLNNPEHSRIIVYVDEPTRPTVEWVMNLLEGSHVLRKGKEIPGSIPMSQQLKETGKLPESYFSEDISFASIDKIIKEEFEAINKEIIPGLIEKYKRSARIPEPGEKGREFYLDQIKIIEKYVNMNLKPKHSGSIY